jgi:phosphoribosylanthranilate isomerase
VTRVKICGLTRLEDAELAVSLGAWALGFILWERSPRACDPAVAAGLSQALRRKAHTVAVFVEPQLDEVAEAVETGAYSHVQLHGDVGPSFCAEIQRRTGTRVIKAVNVRSGEDVQLLDRFRSVDLHLLDGRRPGGGEAWDWALSARRRTKVPLILSGGLTAENVADGIAAVRPYAVDVASGVEAEPGVKDHERLRAFFAAAMPEGPPPEPGAARRAAKAEAEAAAAAAAADEAASAAAAADEAAAAADAAAGGPADPAADAEAAGAAPAGPADPATPAEQIA